VSEGRQLNTIARHGVPRFEPPFSSHTCDVTAQRHKLFGIASVFGDRSECADRQGGSDVRELTDAELQYLTESQSLTRDEGGREVLVGLTDQESNLLMAYRRRLAAGSTDEDMENLTIWLELAERHERARPL